MAEIMGNYANFHATIKLLQYYWLLRINFDTICDNVANERINYAVKSRDNERAHNGNIDCKNG